MHYRQLSILVHALIDEPYIYSGLLCISIAFLFFNRLNGNEKIALAIVIISYFTDFFATVFAVAYHSNVIIYDMLLPAEQLMFIYLFNKILLPGKRKKLLLTVAVILFIFTFINIIFLQGTKTWDTNSYIPANLLIAVYSFVYLRQCMEDIDHSPYRNLLWWFSVATLIDYTGSLPVLATLNWLQNIPDMEIKLLNIIISTLYNGWFLVITIGILCTKRRKVYYSPL